MAGRNLCRDQAVTQIVCENILFLIAGYSSDQLNKVSSAQARGQIDLIIAII